MRRRRISAVRVGDPTSVSAPQNVAEHVLECAGCTEYIEQIRRTAEALRHLDSGRGGPGAVRPVLRARLVDAFRQHRAGS